MRMHVLLLAAALAISTALPGWCATPTTPSRTPPTRPPSTTGQGTTMTPAMRAHMMAMLQNLLIMTQNTAVWTPQGLVVLQGNQLLHYGPDLTLRRTVALPLPPTPAATPTPAPGSMTMPPLASMVPAKVVTTDTGLIVVRGQQIIQLDQNFAIVKTVMLPTLPALTTAETAAVCPLCQVMSSMPDAMLMPATTPAQ